MSNDEIKQLMVDIYNTFFLKWRNKVPAPDNAEWDVITQEVHELMEKHGEETYPIILWFLDQLENRCKEIYKTTNRRKPC